MNMHNVGVPPPPQPQQQQPPQPLDNISKIKSLIGPLKDSLSGTLKTAAQTLNQNSQVDVGSVKGVVDVPVLRFDKSLEEFYSICDQIELHLKTSIKCISQSSSSQRYLPLQVAPTRMESLPGMQDTGTLTYPQFLATASAQVAYTKEVHDTLVAAAQNISPSLFHILLLHLILVNNRGFRRNIIILFFAPITIISSEYREQQEEVTST